MLPVALTLHSLPMQSSGQQQPTVVDHASNSNELPEMPIADLNVDHTLPDGDENVDLIGGGLPTARFEI